MDGAVATTEVETAIPRVEAEIAFNVAYRIVGLRPDATEATEEALHAARQSHPDAPGERLYALLAATSNACHRLIPRRQRGLPAETVPAAADSEDAIAAASMRLPVRQREALALDELGRLSYGQIATIMELGERAVAQLILRARINLNDELRGTVVASIAAPSQECEKALPSIAMRQDGQLDPTSPDAAWLDAHIADCERCRLALKAMGEAAEAYRSWAPVAVPAALLELTQEETEVAADAPGDSQPRPGDRRPHRRLAVAAALAALVAGAGLGGLLVGDESATAPLEPAADAAPAPKGGASPSSTEREGKGKARETEKRRGISGGATAGGEAAATPIQVAAPAGDDGSSGSGGGGGRPGGEAAVEPTQATAAPKPGSKSKPVQTTAAAPQPAPEPTPAPAEEPPAEESGPGQGKKQEPPGKAVGRPSK